MSQANRVLVVALFSYLLIILDISVVLTGLPDIREAFDLSAIGLSWVQNAYLLCFGGFLLLAARAGDHFGRKRVFLIGLGIFTASSLAIGLASSAALLIGARAVQGVGAALCVPEFTRLLGNGRLAMIAFAILAAGLAWLGRAPAEASYARHLFTPMILIGIGNGLGLGPLTVAGVAGVADEDQGAASGVVNVFHQLGGSLGLGILVVVFASACGADLSELQALGHRIGAANTAAAALSAMGLVVCVFALRPAIARR